MRDHKEPDDFSNFGQRGILERARGGACLYKHRAVSHISSIPTSIKHIHFQRIAAKAVESIQNGDTIILSSGQIIQEIAKRLINKKGLTVITNAMDIASKLSNQNDIKWIIPGGVLNKATLSLGGDSAERGIQQFNCDKFFLEAEGIDRAHGISTRCKEEAILLRSMIKVSGSVVVVADSTRFSKKCKAYISAIDEVDTIITDRNILQQQVNQIQDVDVRLLTV